MKLLFIILSFFLILPVAHAQSDYYGAIYINEKTGIPGTSWDYGSVASAQLAARKLCIQKNKGLAGRCVEMGWVVNGCLAAGWSAKKQGAASDWTDNMEGAKTRARTACQERTHMKDCEVVSAFCTTVETVTWYYY